MLDKTGKINIREIQLIIYDFDGIMIDNRVLLIKMGKNQFFVTEPTF